MKKKVVILITVVLVLIFSAILFLTDMFTRSLITGKLYQVDNVYEEILNLVIDERSGKSTILTTATEGAFVDYDFGLFESVHPADGIALSFDGYDLIIYLYEDDPEDNSCYAYNYQTNTLYGDRDEFRLYEKFISSYFSWVGDTGKFNATNQGAYKYEYCEYPRFHDSLENK